LQGRPPFTPIFFSPPPRHRFLLSSRQHSFSPIVMVPPDGGRISARLGIRWTPSLRLRCLKFLPLFAVRTVTSSGPSFPPFPRFVWSCLLCWNPASPREFPRPLAHPTAPLHAVLVFRSFRLRVELCRKRSLFSADFVMLPPPSGMVPATRCSLPLRCAAIKSVPAPRPMFSRPTFPTELPSPVWLLF